MTPEPWEETLGMVKGILDKNNPESLMQKEKLGEQWSFAQLSDDLERLFRLIERFDTTDLQYLSKVKIDKIEAQLKNVENTTINPLRNFDSTIQRASVNRDALLRNVHKYIDQFYTALDDVIMHLDLIEVKSTLNTSELKNLKGATESMIDESNRKMKGLVEQLEAKEKDLALKTAEIAKIEENMRMLSVEKGVETHVGDFSKESKKYRKEMRIWIALFSLATIATLCMASQILDLKDLFGVKDISELNELKNIYVVQVLFGKVFYIALLSSLMVWSAKNFKSAKHNLTINRHRANALATFRTFVDGTDDVSIKNSVLLRASECVFNHQNTGYSSESHDVAPLPHILNMFEAITRK